MDTMKFVILGDRQVGKSALAHCYWLQKWPRGDPDILNFDDYIPTAAEQVSRQMRDTDVHLSLLDTLQFKDNAATLSLTYPTADAFILAYAVDKYVDV